MKARSTLVSLLVIAACRAPSGELARAPLAEPSGLERVTLLSKGME